MSNRLIPGFNDDVCPVCHADRYLNPSLKLLVSPCYHKMCENCINRLFLAGPGPCPICKQTLRKSNFVAQTFEDLYVEKEVQIRKRIGKYFNKRLEDFAGNLKKYNDYLEEVEEIMFNLINDVDVQATNERIERFRQENKDIIAQNLAKQASYHKTLLTVWLQMNEDKVISYKLKKEKEERKIRRDAYMVKALEEEKMKKAEKENIIQQLASSDKSAEDIVSDSIQKRNTTSADDVADDALLGLMDTDMDDEVILEELQAPFDPMDHEYVDPADFKILEVYNDP
ncbi:TFIIH/NER complex subunit [Phlyctochytrium bullatum]|nr:TFIIH/NER complex subunit [Phlyctochytrium bullatum]